MKIKSTLAATILATAIAMTTSAFAGGFCEVPDVLEEGTTYDIVMATSADKVHVLVGDIDDDACWVKVTDESFRIVNEMTSPVFYLNIRQMVVIIPKNQR